MNKSTKSPLFLIGESTESRIIEKIKELGFLPIILPSDKRLPLPTRSHADMLLFLIDTHVFCNKLYFQHNTDVFNCISNYGYTVVPCDFDVKDAYPYDVALNQALIEKHIVGNQKYCAAEILEYANKNGYSCLQAKQGYAKCSTLILNEKAIITADDSIINTVKGLDLDALKIQNRENEITLCGYDYGFIGGASAVYDNTVYFFGNIQLHQNGKEILSFCHKHGFSTVNLSENQLTDLGGAFILPFLKN